MQQLDSLTQHNKTLLVGDLNARHVTWGNRRANRNGTALHDYAGDNGIAVIGPDSPTHFPSNGSRPSTIDLIVSKNIPYPLFPHTITDLDSDHLPILTYLSTPLPDVPDIISYDYSQTNWKIFRRLLTDTITITNNIQTDLELENEVTIFTQNIQKARDKTAKKRRAVPTHYSLPQDILDLIKFKNNILQRWHRHRRQQDRIRAKELSNTISERISAHKNNMWNSKLQSLSTTDNSIWKLTQALKRTREPVPTLHYNNNEAMTSVEKAETLAAYYHSAYVTPPDDIDEQSQTTTHADALPESVFLTQRQRLKTQTTSAKVSKLLRQLPSRNASGSDIFHNIVLRNLPRKVIIQLSYIINAIIVLQKFPDQ